MKILSSDIIFSGIQPSGILHIGNYLGAIRNWVQLQQKYVQTRRYYSIVDLHSLTDKFHVDHSIEYKDTLYRDSYTLAATLLASGIDPQKSTIFIQSHVPQHTELAWILSCIGPMSWLNKMTQYKDKKTRNSSLGLYAYPTLMAADILLYKATLVPVGEDQIQHIEITRDYAERFNTLFAQKPTDKLPLPLYIQTQFPKIMSLKDPNKKMSKSDHTDTSRINITDNPETIHYKLRKAKTDSIGTIKYADNRPEISNLIRIYSDFSGLTITQIEEKYSHRQTTEFKDDLAEIISTCIYPIALKTQDILQDQEYLNNVLKYGAQQAQETAQANLNHIKKLMGFIV